MTLIEKLKLVFTDIPDPRIDRTKRHPLTSILFIAVCSAMAGIDEWVGMEDYCDANLEFFSQYVELPEGAPSHDTIGRVMSKINPDSFQAAFIEFTKALAARVPGVTSIDGKTARGSADPTSMKKAFHSVSAWSSANSLVLAQVVVEDKANEITAIPKLLEMLDLEGEIITIDAMGCQRTIAQQIVEKGGDYVLALKGNQATLHEDVRFLFDEYEKTGWDGFVGDMSVDFNKDHGRIEERIHRATEELGALGEIHEWPGLRSVLSVESNRTVDGKTSKERRLYLSSLNPDAEMLGKCVRSHWEVENKVHWILDVTFNEDRSQIRKDNGPLVMNILRKWSLNVLGKAKGKLSMRRMQNRLRMSTSRLKEILDTII